MYAEYLGWRGLDAREVHTAAEAILEIGASRPDVLVTEDRLPDSTAVELARALRRSRYTFDLPIVLLSSNAFRIQPDHPRAYGCDVVLTVPVLPEALAEELRRFVETREHALPAQFESWLFVRGGESVWMVRTADLELAVAGPGRGRGSYAFRAERELHAFQADYQQRLARTGFALELHGADRRSGRDRRRASRGSDRRALH